MNDGHSAKRAAAASADTDGPAPSAAVRPACGLQRPRLPHSLGHFAPAGAGIFNAKAQRRGDATRSFGPCDFATWRLCVNRSFPASAALEPSKTGCRRQNLPVKSSPVKPSQNKMVIISDGHRPPLQQSNSVKPSQTQSNHKVALTASFGGSGGKAALAHAHSKAACRPRGLAATRLGARKASSGLALKLRLSSVGMQYQPEKRRPIKPRFRLIKANYG